MAREIGSMALSGYWNRRSYLIDRGFQLKYALIMAAAAGLVAVVFGLWLRQTHDATVASAGLDYLGRKVVESSDRLLFTVFAGVAAMVAVGLGLVGVFMTHRVAGPVMLMRRYLAAFANGRYPRMRALRRSDELMELFVTVGDAIERTREREVRQVELLDDAVVAMRSAAERAPQLLPTVERLAREVEERRAALGAAEHAAVATVSK